MRCRSSKEINAPYAMLKAVSTWIRYRHFYPSRSELELILFHLQDQTTLRHSSTCLEHNFCRTLRVIEVVPPKISTIATAQKVVTLVKSLTDTSHNQFCLSWTLLDELHPKITKY